MFNSTVESIRTLPRPTPLEEVPRPCVLALQVKGVTFIRYSKNDRRWWCSEKVSQYSMGRQSSISEALVNLGLVSKEDMDAHFREADEAEIQAELDRVLLNMDKSFSILDREPPKDLKDDIAEAKARRDGKRR